MTSFVVALLVSPVAHAACVLSGARPTVALPTMPSGQEFSFIASRDCETLRFTIRGTDVSKRPMSGGPVGPGHHTYKVALTDSEWDAVVDASGSTLTWVVTGRTSAGVMTRLVTTNDLKRDEQITIDLSKADAKIVATEDLNVAGVSVAGAGDVDGDGHDDVLVGATTTKVTGMGDTLFGATFLVLGPVTGNIDLSQADAKLLGEERYDYFYSSVSGAGDVDDDGHDDLLIGASEHDRGGQDAGAAYVVLGPVTGTLDLSLADAELVGETQYDRAGSSVSGGGDVDGDGHPDLLVGAYFDDDGGTEAGAAYLVLGTVTGTLDLSRADAKFVGENRLDYAGVVSGAGDVDADGHDDVLMGASSNDEGDHDAGAAYLVLGPVTGSFDLSLADAKLVGDRSGDYAGGSVSDAGDVDSDGHDDVLVGAYSNDEKGNDAGAAYLVLGPVTGTLDLTLADAKLVGGVGDQAGFRVSGAGDVDADGRDDVLIGAPAHEVRTGVVGAAFLIYGGGL